MRPLTEWFAAAGLPDPECSIKVSGFQADSRKIKPGEVFVAIGGTTQNGFDYIAGAIERGAVAVVAAASFLRTQESISMISEGVYQSTAFAGVIMIGVDNTRLAYARLCAAMYPHKPQHLVAVTGTNGKTSVAEFYRQLWALEGEQAASVGTLGLTLADGSQSTDWASGNTSPAPDILHAALQQLAQEDIHKVALEASSHGLDQYRLDGLHFEAVAFTNLTQDHLDYHGTMEAYYQAKRRLFTDFRAQVLANADDTYGQRLLKELQGARSYGRAGEWLTLCHAETHESGLSFTLQYEDNTTTISVPLYGEFQIHNLMAAGGLALLSGMSWQAFTQHLPGLYGVRGRMEKVATHPCGASIFVDYAHTPDALKHLLISLRAHCPKKLHVVFGCGGDRDTTKRAPMGSIAANYADRVIVTDDNPRSEDPEVIRRQILDHAAGAGEVADRAVAIQQAVTMLQPGDVLVVAGKGHETNQIVGSTSYEFNDAEHIKQALEAL